MFLLWWLAACSQQHEQSLLFEFPVLQVAPGQQLVSVCQSVSLDNDEPIPVNKVTMDAGPAWHHANWYYVPEDRFEGPDGTWNCSDRAFETLTGGLWGGVIYAMSTQTRHEVQAFQPGAAVVIPPRSKLVGEVHLINASDAPVTTSMSLELAPIPDTAVDIALQPSMLIYLDLALPPLARSRFSTDCDLAAAWGAPLDMRIHYVLPHYHELGDGFGLEVLGGAADGQSVFQAESAIGEPLGGTLDPPVDISGADGLRFSCSYQNTTSDVVGWGLGGREMCVGLAFVDSPFRWILLVQGGTEYQGQSDGVMEYEGACEVFTLRAG